jgi:hypothetical protein
VIVRENGPVSARRTVIVGLAIAVLVGATLASSRFWEDDTSGATAASPTSTQTTPISADPSAPPRLNPLTPTDASRLPSEEAGAIVRLALLASPSPPADGEGHSHAPTPTLPLTPDDAPRFDAQYGGARVAALALSTPELAEAAGYRSAAVPGSGVGTHFVKWSLIDQPFDPGRPSMLLFDLRPGRTPQIAGLSYLVRSPVAPEGFAGPADVWHQHFGMCVVNGWIDRENAPRSDCAGSWFAGGDLWMLHAWVVPGWENRSGLFANLNPKLCPPDAGTPDISRCSFFEGASGN